MGFREHTFMTSSGGVLHPNQLMVVESWSK